MKDHFLFVNINNSFVSARRSLVLILKEHFYFQYRNLKYINKTKLDSLKNVVPL